MTNTYVAECFTCGKLDRCAHTSLWLMMRCYVCRLHALAAAPTIQARGVFLLAHGPNAAARVLLNVDQSKEGPYSMNLENPTPGTTYSARKQEFLDPKTSFMEIRLLGTKKYKKPDDTFLLDWDETLRVPKTVTIEKVLEFELANGIIVADSQTTAAPQGVVQMALPPTPVFQPGMPPPPQQPMPQGIPQPPQMAMPPPPPGMAPPFGMAPQGVPMPPPPQGMPMPPPPPMPPGAMPPPPATPTQAAQAAQEAPATGKKKRGAAAAPPPPAPPAPPTAVPQMAQAPQMMAPPPMAAPAPNFAPQAVAQAPSFAPPTAAPTASVAFDPSTILARIDEVGKAINTINASNAEAMKELKGLTMLMMAALQHIYLSQPGLAQAAQGKDVGDVPKFIEYMKAYVPR